MDLTRALQGASRRRRGARDRGFGEGGCHHPEAEAPLFRRGVAFVTSVGHRHGGDSRGELGYGGAGPTIVITDLGILRPDPKTKELTMTALHPGTTVEEAKDATGWDLKVAEELETTDPPTEGDLTILRDLKARTANHGRGPKGGAWTASLQPQWSGRFRERRQKTETQDEGRSMSYGGTKEAGSWAVRTPIGRHGGALSAVRPDDLAPRPRSPG